MKKEITIQLCLLGSALLIMLGGIFMKSPIRAINDGRIEDMLSTGIGEDGSAGDAEGAEVAADSTPAPAPPRETEYETPTRPETAY